ncbi:MAG: cysteine synthase family protein [Proteobacteria bacterium]|nr:cysteine synthase family protein [Pseudomonadota bacterium]
MHYYSSFHDLIGHTPLVKIGHFDLPEGVNIFAKLELYNPLGSVKDRTGRHMLAAAEQRGDLREGGTVIMATAGNTGLGIAFAALNRNYRIIFVVPEKFSEEKQVLMQALGAEIIHTPREGGMLEAGRRAAELHQKIPGSVLLNQFSDQSNPQSHYETTGPEIYQDLDGKIDYFIAGAGSGGTFTGIARYLKSRLPALKAVIADPVGSTITGGEHADYNIEGIGNDFIADTLDISLMDLSVKITDREAIDTCRELARREGIIAGSSSGAALCGALKLARSGVTGNIVCVLPDRGDRYFSKSLFEPVP